MTGAAPPPAPWRSEVDAVLWWHRGGPAAAALLPPDLAAKPLPLVLGGLIAYRKGPVGPYGEVFGAVMVRRGARVAGHVPFMAVDSAASVAGGRANWALPKELAAFDGEPGMPGRTAARGHGWELELVARARPRVLPAWAAAACVQAWPDGAARTFPVALRGRAHLGSVDVRHAPGSSPAGWLLPGRHPAAFLSGVQTVGPPRP